MLSNNIKSIKETQIEGLMIKNTQDKINGIRH